MLEIARKPFPVNPTPALLAAAVKHGWGSFPASGYRRRSRSRRRGISCAGSKPVSGTAFQLRPGSGYTGSVTEEQPEPGVGSPPQNDSAETAASGANGAPGARPNALRLVVAALMLSRRRSADLPAQARSAHGAAMGVSRRQDRARRRPRAGAGPRAERGARHRRRPSADASPTFATITGTAARSICSSSPSTSFAARSRTASSGMCAG